LAELKNLSNPSSTGGAGIKFEIRVQTGFVVLMLTNGVMPCLPAYPLEMVALQRKHRGIQTDDFVITVRDPKSKTPYKLFAQAKRSCAITSNSTFQEVITAMWSDFRNQDVFISGRDALALVTQTLSKADIENVCEILEWARTSDSAEYFQAKIFASNFSSKTKQDKYSIFKQCLTNANKEPLPEEEIWLFLKHFYLLGYDLDIPNGVNVSLLKSIVRFYNNDVNAVWCQVQAFVQEANSRAGEVTRDTIPLHIQDLFKTPEFHTIPGNLLESVVEPQAIPTVEIDTKDIPVLAQLLLVPEWVCESEADQKVVEKITVVKYSELENLLRKYAFAEDFFVVRKKTTYKIRNLEKAWTQYGKFITNDNLKNIKNVYIDILGETHPKFDLPEDQRYMFNILGKMLTHSETLRTSIVDVLALLGEKPEAFSTCSGNKIRAVLYEILDSIFKGKDWKYWGTIDHLLPIIVESIPDVLLDIISTALDSKPDIFTTLFSLESTGVTGANYMTGLWWALETLAWNENYLYRVADLLLRFNSIDPGGNYVNRPGHSFVSIFRPWYPQTSASIDKRVDIVTALLRDSEEIGWNIILNFLPRSHQIASDNHAPKWRKWKPEDYSPKVTNIDFFKQVDAYFNLLIKYAKGNLEKTTILLKEYKSLWPQHQDVIITLIKELEPQLKAQEKEKLWNICLGYISEGRKYNHLSDEACKKLNSLESFLGVLPPILRHKRLFSLSNRDLYEKKGDWKEQEIFLTEKRVAALNELYDIDSMQAIEDFLSVGVDGRNVGIALANIEKEEIQKAILPQWVSKEKVYQDALFAFIGTNFWKKKYGWVNSIDISFWQQEERAFLFRVLSFSKETWDLVETYLEDEALYWSSCRAFPDDTENALFGIEKLLEYKRVDDALWAFTYVQNNNRDLGNEIMFKLLYSVVENQDTVKIDSYEILEIIKALQSRDDVDESQMIGIEYRFLPLLNRLSSVNPVFMERKMARDPVFFIEIINYIYKSSNVPPDEVVTDDKKKMAERLFPLLDDWRTVPGYNSKGVFSSSEFEHWVVEVERLAQDKGYEIPVKRHIGKILFYSKEDPSGLWIQTEVAEYLNRRENKHVRDAFQNQCYNSRGVHYFTQGQEENEIAEKYEAKAVALEKKMFFIFADTIREVSKNYLREAAREVERNQFGDYDT